MKTVEVCLTVNDYIWESSYDSLYAISKAIDDTFNNVSKDTEVSWASDAGPSKLYCWANSEID